MLAAGRAERGESPVIVLIFIPIDPPTLPFLTPWLPDSSLASHLALPRAAALLFALLPLHPAFAFDPPGPELRRAAVGDLTKFPPHLQRAFDPDSPAFPPVPAPGPGSWLNAHEELGQTFSQFVAASPNLPTAARHTIYLQPLGDFAPERSPSLLKLRDFAAAFFALEVKTLPALPVAAWKITSRQNSSTGKNQLLTSDILAALGRRLPPDAFCILAVTMEDLYPEPSWNYVFGQASLRDRTGVYSFARYDPLFFDEPRPPDYQALLLRRSCSVLAHETGHMFGLAHCIYFKCVMNGSNHLVESDQRPLHLCPVCLRKLQWSAGFDVVKRYSTLEAIDRACGFADESEWMTQRVKVLRQN